MQPKRLSDLAKSIFSTEYSTEYVLEKFRLAK